MQQPASTPSDVTLAAANALACLREKGPRVHCITNAVAQNFTANVLLSLGCVPSMTLSGEEIANFVAGAQALLVNLGTFDAERRQATELAVKAAADNKIPWVLDPVFVDRSRPRADYARALLSRGPSAVRLNGAELSALADGDASPGTFARTHKTIVGLSGATDVITDGARLARVANGHLLMSRVTAMGCAASALAAACLAVEPDPFSAVASALLIIGVAGELAGEKVAGPGSFAVAIIDALDNLKAATLTARARVT